MSGRPARNRFAASKLTDPSNDEPPGSVHHAVLQDTQARLTLVNEIMGYIQNIDDLSYVLPASIAEGTAEDEIHRVITTVPGLDPDCPDSTFNRRFDILFKEDAQCRKNGRLHLIRRGEYVPPEHQMGCSRHEFAWRAGEAGADNQGDGILEVRNFPKLATAPEAKKKAKAIGKTPKAKPDAAKSKKSAAKSSAPVDQDDKAEARQFRTIALDNAALRPLFLKNSDWELLEALDNVLKVSAMLNCSKSLYRLGSSLSRG
ncbi:hypothetical protein B0H16DRAFT_1464332 [Mycena metata]|uniref:Uncharacterized protein n=1 Tax=Mycena metata TaxID=1033252 RepID=A0AAD7N1P7_9AGAR|nr:hypothetical protein B0H16DRAFT_1464332 [Mycena metata]